MSAGENHDLYQNKWITDKAYISGLSGVVMLLLLAYLFHYYHVFEFGINVFGVLIQGRPAVSGFALILISLTMVLVEFIRLWRFDPLNFICYSPLWTSKQYKKLLIQAVKKYSLNLVLLLLAALYYFSINEYGYRAQSTYYQPWFRVFKSLAIGYVFFGFPYHLLTVTFKHSSNVEMSDVLVNTMIFLKQLLKGQCANRMLSSEDKKIALGFLVKLFFAPIMTVFFFDNFYHLVSNINYINISLIPKLAMGSYTHTNFNQDLTNIVPTLIFTIDVALAWCGYVVSSRWLDNQTVSTEPTILGWFVCLLSYPPFRLIPGWLVSMPDEKLYLQLPDQWLISALALLMIASYFFYMLPTIFFGVRFSNLTNRGIIRTGPFSYVRHPAYAAKNIAWWLVGMPVAIYSGVVHGIGTMFLMLLGLLVMTGIYYLRAITEEKHLGVDPYYQSYCREVKYRFIPNVV